MTQRTLVGSGPCSARRDQSTTVSAYSKSSTAVTPRAAAAASASRVQRSVVAVSADGRAAVAR